MLATGTAGIRGTLKRSVADALALPNPFAHSSASGELVRVRGRHDASKAIHGSTWSIVGGGRPVGDRISEAKVVGRSTAPGSSDDSV